jgi:tripartite-type tricarboxylate transporter receptor subunit TctC
MRLRGVLLAFGVLVVGAGGALGQPPFAGRTVTVLVGNPPGGGYDRFARIVAFAAGRRPGG